MQEEAEGRMGSGGGETERDRKGEAEGGGPECEIHTRSTALFCVESQCKLFSFVAS